jgi:glycine/D-amino acid oxidase-like deaminating enzyme
VKKGHAVTIYEQGPIPNPLGSSVDRHRLIRFPYGADAGYFRMVGEAYDTWERLWEDLGARHYQETGTLVLKRSESGWGAASERMMVEHGLDVRPLQGRSLRDAYPLYRFDDVDAAFYAPTGGALFADRIVGGLAAWLRTNGARLHPHRRVIEVDPAAARVHLGDGQTDDGDVLIIAAGPWVNDLLPALRSRVSPSRQLVIYLEIPPAKAAAWERMPMLLDIDGGHGYYLIPPVGGTKLKIGDHRFTKTGHPGDAREASAQEQRSVLSLARSRFTDGEDYLPDAVKTCYYTVEPEERFIIEPLEKAWLMTGFSGHGFKFSALLGERLAAAVLSEIDPATITAWAAGYGR